MRARDLLQSFDSLSETEKKEVASEILRRSASLDLVPFSDEDLVLNAKQLFLELDRQQSTNG